MTTEKVTLKDVYMIVARLEEKMENSYVTKTEFWPVRTIVYGGAGLILVGVFGYLINLAIK